MNAPKTKEPIYNFFTIIVKWLRMAIFQNNYKNLWIGFKQKNMVQEKLKTNNMIPFTVCTYQMAIMLKASRTKIDQNFFKC